MYQQATAIFMFPTYRPDSAKIITAMKYVCNMELDENEKKNVFRVAGEIYHSTWHL